LLLISWVRCSFIASLFATEQPGQDHPVQDRREYIPVGFDSDILSSTILNGVILSRLLCSRAGFRLFCP
jgi:hypothetical protein